MKDLKISLTLTVEQTNLALHALSKLPYETVVGLIGIITSQAEAQIRAKDEPKTGEQILPPSEVNVPKEAA